MTKRNEELDQLLRQFMDETHAHQAWEELEAADRLFDAYPVPAVRRKTVIAIQENLRRQLNHWDSYIAWLWRISAVAAVVGAVLLAGIYFLHNSDRDVKPFMPGVFATALDWNNNRYAEDSPLAKIENELQDVAESMQTLSVETFKPVNTLSQDMMELDEIELLANNTEFWKG
jgi:hypothetical protein